MKNNAEDPSFAKGHGRLWEEAMIGLSFLREVACMLRELPFQHSSWNPELVGEPLGINTGGWMLFEQLLVHAYANEQDYEI
jgi:hypothetical protein